MGTALLESSFLEWLAAGESRKTSGLIMVKNERLANAAVAFRDEAAFGLAVTETFAGRRRTGVCSQDSRRRRICRCTQRYGCFLKP